MPNAQNMLFTRTSQLLLLSIICILSSHLAKAQEFYGSDGSGGLVKISLTGGFCTGSIIPACNPSNGTFNSIAIGRDTFYGTDPSRFLKRAVFINNVFSSCVTIGQMSTPLTSLTIDSLGNLYGAYNYGLYKINTQTAVATLLGTMPYSSAGDLIFYNGNLYMAGLSPTPGIIKVNISNPALSTMYIPMTQTAVIGLVNIAIGCNENRVYALNRSGSSTQIIELNMATQTVVGQVCSVQYAITDGASPVESGIFSGIRIQNIKILPECTNRPGSASIQVNTVNGIVPYSFQLNGGAINTTGLFTSLTSGNYALHITSPDGCFKDTNLVVPIADTPQLQIQTTSTFCNSVGTITISATSTRPPFAFNINQGPVQSSGTFNGLAAGNYVVQVIDSNRCTSTKTAIVQAIRPPIVQQIIITNTDCNVNNGAINITTSGAAATYSINNGVQQNTGQFSGLAAGSYTVSTFSSQGCRYDTILRVNFNRPPIAFSIVNTPATCHLNNGQLIVSATNAIQYSINNGAQQQGQFNNLPAGNYTVSAFTNAGCRTDTNIVIADIPHAAPAIQIIASAPNCYDRANGNIQLTVIGQYTPYTYSLQSSGFGNQTNFPNLQSGPVQLRIKDSSGCVTDTSATVPVYRLIKPTVTFTKKNPSCILPNSGAVQLNVTGSGSPYRLRYRNSSFPANQSFTDFPAGNHTFNINDQFGCTVDSALIVLDLIQLSVCDTVYVPTAFTPDKDGKNETFKATAYGTLLHFNLAVYNRFGQQLFRSSDVNKAWDGKVNGRLQPAGAYIWMMSYTFGSRPERKQKGTILLIQ